jgi:hypothetical protein
MKTLTVNIADNTAADLMRLSKMTGISITKMVERGLFLAAIYEHARQVGDRICIVRGAITFDQIDLDPPPSAATTTGG